MILLCYYMAILYHTIINPLWTRETWCRVTGPYRPRVPGYLDRILPPGMDLPRPGEELQGRIVCAVVSLWGGLWLGGGGV
jgi:hypothetical protein